MPYITKEKRVELDEEINDLIKVLSKNAWNVGMVNYAISQIMWNWFREMGGYATINSIRGVLGCVWDEFYRRLGAPYEDMVKGKNGDLSSFTHFFDDK